MKYFIFIVLLLSIGQKSYAQNCTSIQDTITVCGLEYDLKLRVDNGTLDAICPSPAEHIALSMTDSVVHITVTACGVYELTHTYQNTIDNCTVEDFYVIQMDDPSNQSIYISSDLSVAYAPQEVHMGAVVSCDDPDPTTVGIEGVAVPQINWEECNDFSSQTTIYTASVFAPNPATDCEVDSIQINIDTQSGMSNTSNCDGFGQSDFYGVAAVDFLDLINAIGNTELSDWLSTTIDVPATNCGLNIDYSTTIDTVIQQLTLDIPVRTGGNWSIIQNGTNTLLQDTTNLTLGLDDNYYLFIEPGADHIGPDSLFFQLLYGDDVDDLDTIPQSQTLTLQWIEFWDTISVMTIDTSYVTNQYGCGGLYISSQSISLPGAPPSPFEPINIGFPNCDCPPPPTAYFTEVIDCYNPCVFTANGETFCSSGTYQVILTDEQTGCTSIEQYDIIGDFDIPYININSGGNITCTNPCPILELISDPWAFYEWYTPSGSFENSAIINACEPGTYQGMVCGYNGCCDFVYITVTEDITSPTIEIIGDTELTCDNPCVTLTGITNADESYTWEGNGNIFDGQGIDVCSPGTYSVTVTDFNNGCTATESITVTQALSQPEINIIGQSELNCSNPCTTLFVEGIDPNANDYLGCTWSDNGDFSTNTFTEIEVCAAGVYTVEAFFISGCSSISSFEVTENFTLPIIDTSFPDVITCDQPCVTIEAFTDAPPNCYWVDETGNFVGELMTAEVCAAGVYTVFVEGINGCQTQATVIVMENFIPPTIEIIGGGVLTCTEPCVTISAMIEAEPNCVWETPFGEIIEGQTIEVCSPGIYTVTVTNEENGCTATESIAISGDSNIPTIETNIPDVITCDHPCVTIEAFTDAPPNCYWVDETGNFVGELMTAEVCAAGVYTVFVEGINGCQTQATVTVMENFIPPTIEIIGGGTLSCIDDSIPITGMIDTDPNCTWTGPNNFVGNGQTIEVTISGTYCVIATNLDNGCTATECIVINENVNIPQVFITGNTVFCEGEETLLSAGTDASNLAFQWNTEETTASILVDSEGIYSVTITDTDNGCTSSAEIVLTEAPNPAPLFVGSTSICEGEFTTITVVDQNGGELEGCQWSDGSLGNTINIGQAGEYCVDAINQFGCSVSTCVTIVVSETPIPTITGNAVLCEGETTMLTASDNFINYSWSTNETTSSIEVASSGTYAVTVINALGCVGITQMEVAVENAPLLDLEQLLTIECNMEQVSPVFNSNTDNLSFEWTGDNGFISNDIEPIFDQVGIYNLAATTISGCTNYSSVEVIDNRQYPIISAVADTIDCDDGIVYVQGTSDIPNSSFIWTGPDNYINFDSIALVSDAGIYFLTVTAPNGCFDTVSVEVISDLQVINLAVSADTIDCIQTNINIQTNAVENATYAWTGPNGYVSSDMNPSVNEAGMYNLEVVYGNNCSTSTSIEIIENKDIPAIFVPTATITCQMENLVLEPESSVLSLNYSWTGSNGFMSTDSNPTIDEAGTYSLEVQNIDNGCTNTTDVVIDAIEPISVSFTTETTCSNLADGSIDLNQISGGLAPYSIQWAATNSTDFDLDDLAVGGYQYEINDSGDCIEQGIITVESAPTNIIVTQEKMDICEGTETLLNPIELYDLSENVIVEWQNGNNSNSLMIDAGGTYQATLEEGCDVYEHIYDVTETKDYSNRIYIPNAFSPNGDGVNDEFLPQAHSELTNYTLSVFDRWGNLLFQNADTETGWNGMENNSNELKTGVFIYHLRADVQNCEGDIVLMEKFGDVTLMK